MKYTIICTDNWVSGSRMHHIVQNHRIEKFDSESWKSALLRYNIEITTINYIFKGWSELEGDW